MTKPKRTRELTIRLHDAELAAMRSAAAARGVGMADLARSLLADAAAAPIEATGQRRGKAPRQRPAPIADSVLVCQIARIGNNLNQLAKFANTHTTGADPARIVSELMAIGDSIKSLIPGADSKC